MGELAERVAVSVGGKGSHYRTCETNHVGVSSQEDSRRSKSTVGEGARGAEEGGIVPHLQAGWLLLRAGSHQQRSCNLQRAQMGHLRLGGEKSIVSVLCADIRGFARLTADMPTDEVVSLLNEYFAALTDCIFRNDGTVDKFVGDAILAVFGSPEEAPQHCRKAVLAGMNMQAAAKEVSHRRAARGEVCCEIGIGIHTGEILHGFIGSPDRMEYTVIGDAVNRTSRYCAGARGCEVLISPEIHQRTWNAVKAQQISIPTKHEGDLVACRVDRVRERS
jgi:adenylate cyclase